MPLKTPDTYIDDYLYFRANYGLNACFQIESRFGFLPKSCIRHATSIQKDIDSYHQLCIGYYIIEPFGYLVGFWDRSGTNYDTLSGYNIPLWNKTARDICAVLKKNEQTVIYDT
jgi:hypothetical protein